METLRREHAPRDCVITASLGQARNHTRHRVPQANTCYVVYVYYITRASHNSGDYHLYKLILTRHFDGGSPKKIYRCEQRDKSVRCRALTFQFASSRNDVKDDCQESKHDTYERDVVVSVLQCDTLAVDGRADLLPVVADAFRR